MTDLILEIIRICWVKQLKFEFTQEISEGNHASFDDGVVKVQIGDLEDRNFYNTLLHLKDSL